MFKISTEICSRVKNNHLKITKALIATFYELILLLLGILGLARTGLIFTGIQEGAQPGELTPPGQTEQGIPYHVPSCWVPVGGSWVTGTHSGAWGGGRSGRAALWVVRFVLCFPFIYTLVIAVPFVCCSVKLPLSRPTSFCLFLSILLCTPEGGGAAAWRFCCRPQPNHNTRIK